MAQEQDREYTWDDLAAAIGQDFAAVDVPGVADEVEQGAIRKYCEPLEFDCPLHYDDEVARKYGYKGVLAPYSAIHQTFASVPIWRPGEPTRWPSADPDAFTVREPANAPPPLPMPPTTASFVSDMEIEYLAPVYLGDRLRVQGNKLVAATPRKTSIGFGAFLIFEREVRNQRGELVAKVRNGSFRYNPGAES